MGFGPRVALRISDEYAFRCDGQSDVLSIHKRIRRCNLTTYWHHCTLMSLARGMTTLLPLGWITSAFITIWTSHYCASLEKCCLTLPELEARTQRSMHCQDFVISFPVAVAARIMRRHRATKATVLPNPSTTTTRRSFMENTRAQSHACCTEIVAFLISRKILRARSENTQHPQNEQFGKVPRN